LKFLLDTNVVSETRRKKPDTGVLAWLSSVPQEDLFVSAMTVGEFSKGVAKLRRTDASTADQLEHWLVGIEILFADRVIAIDAEIAREWGEISSGRSLPVIDSLLAATARVGNMVMVTRNIRDFASLHVTTINPWAK